jgi:hypothetical protein
MAAMSRARSRSQGPASVYRQTPELPPQTQAAMNATSTGTAGAEAPPASGGNPSGIGFPTTMAPPRPTGGGNTPGFPPLSNPDTGLLNQAPGYDWGGTSWSVSPEGGQRMLAAQQDYQRRLRAEEDNFRRSGGDMTRPTGSYAALLAERIDPMQFGATDMTRHSPYALTGGVPVPFANGSYTPDGGPMQAGPMGGYTPGGASPSPRLVDNPTFPQFGPIPPNGGIQAPVDPNTVVTPPAAPPATPNPAWNTNGYAPPGYTAANPYSAPSGWDATKWADPNHQSPKYVVGRILQEASGGTGALRDQAQRDAAIAKILQAYPGAKFDGKDKVTFPDGGVVDIFGGAGAGQYTAAWMPVTGPGGAALPQGGGGMAQSPQGWTLPYPQAGGDLGNANPGGLNPNGMPFYGADILRYLAQQLGLQNVLGGQIGQR